LDIDDSADLRFRNIGFCFQNALLAPTLTVMENVTLPAVPRGVTDEMRERAVDVLREVGLGERLAHLPSQLSGGEQQRVAIARSLAMNPPLLLVDEPTANLDRSTARSIASLLRSVVDDSRRTVVIATHDPIVIEIAQRVAHLEDGHLSALEAV
jgi:putative ABC transport system ATP-binding protein